MLTPIQFQKLPDLAQVIIQFDREIEFSRGQKVVPFDWIRELAWRRVNLGKKANEVWGRHRPGKGTARQ